MAQTFWNTLATNDRSRARTFYEALGFEVQEIPGGAGLTVKPDASSMLCLFDRDVFARMIPGEVCDASRSQELVQSLQLDSREAVDAFWQKAKAAGARPIGEPGEQPFGYACGFADPDGHVWSVLYMPPRG